MIATLCFALLHTLMIDFLPTSRYNEAGIACDIRLYGERRR